MAITVQGATNTLGIQKDGRVAVIETITLSNGRVEVFSFLLQFDDNLAAHLALTGNNLLAAFAGIEISTNIDDIQTNGVNASPSFIYSIPTANAAAVRTAYLGATDQRAAFIGEYLNSLSNAVLASAFGITTGQAGTLKTNVLAPQAALAVSIRASAGQ